MVFTTFVIVDAMPFQTLVTIPIDSVQDAAYAVLHHREVAGDYADDQAENGLEVPDIVPRPESRPSPSRYRRYLVSDGREHGSGNRKNRVGNAGHDCLYGRPEPLNIC